MFYGSSTEELINIRQKYDQIFGYDPNGEMELEFGPNDYEEYKRLLQECIETRKDMFEVLKSHDKY